MGELIEFEVQDYAFMRVWPPFDGTSADEPQLMRFHGPALCRDQHLNCSIHNQSEHPMRNMPQVWRQDHRIVVRLCPHNQHHPDPDDLAAGKIKCDCHCGCCHASV